MRARIFLLSPASCSGARARQLLREGSDLPVAKALRGPHGLPLGDAFSFMSGLYFRGKRAYAEAFARPSPGGPGVWVITSTRGLLPMEHPVTAEMLEEFAGGDIDPEDPGYREPLRRSGRALRERIGSDGEVVLLGSVATDRYLEPLLEIFGRRLLFPREFVGRGDMSRGGLLLRRARADRELEYVVARDAPRRGARPPRLDPDG